ncbi:MAG: hypothetical protein QXP97_00070 [Desulfurococcus sp.]
MEKRGLITCKKGYAENRLKSYLALFKSVKPATSVTTIITMVSALELLV